METQVRCLTPLALTLASCAMLVIAACKPMIPVRTDARTDTLTATVAVIHPTGTATPLVAIKSTIAPKMPSALARVRPVGSPSASVSVTVTLTVDDATREVLSWFIPVNEARIDRPFYVTTEDACAAWNRTSPMFTWDENLSVDMCSIVPGDYNTVRAPAYVVVAGSFRGIDIEYPGRESASDLDGCEPVSSSHRLAFVALFDATTGRYLGYHPLSGPASVDVLAWYRSLSTDTAVGRRRFVTPPRGPATGSPIDATATTAAARRIAMAPELHTRPAPSLPEGDDPALGLGIGAVPAALAEVASVVPLVPGAWWRYRITEVYDSLHWKQFAFTESIAAGTRLGADLAAVRSRVETDIAVGDPTWIGPWGSGGSASVRFLVPDGVMRPLGDIRPHTPIEEWLSLSPDWGTGSPVYSVRLPLHAGDAYNSWWSSDGVTDVSVPAGEFRHCTTLMEMFNAGNTTAHWLCPGVGYVRHEAPGCSTMHSGYRVYELVDYFVPPVTVVP